MLSKRFRLVCLATTALVALSTGGVAGADSLDQLEYPPYGNFIYGMSRDGNFIVGHDFLDRPLVWDVRTGRLVSTGWAGGSAAFTAVKANGTVIAGARSTGGYYAFRWQVGQTVQMLGNLDGDPAAQTQPSQAMGISDDGNVIVGYVRQSTSGQNRAFRWRAANNKMTDLGTLNGGYTSSANGVSGDGKVVVGVSADGAVNQNRAFRWVVDSTGNGDAGVMENLGTFQNGGGSEAKATNNDGSVVVGNALDSNSNQRAFRWTRQDGMVDLGVLANYQGSKAIAVSGDGRVVVGDNLDLITPGFRAFRWTAQDGMKALDDLLTQAGVNLGGTRLSNAQATNGDGSVIVTSGDNGRFYVARLSVPPPPAPQPQPQPPAPQPPAGLMDVENFNESLSAAATVSNFAYRMADITLNGAHGKPTRGLLDDGQTAIWTAGDLARLFADGFDGSKGLVEIGAARGLEGDMNLRLSVGTFGAEGDLDTGGNFRGRMLYAVPELTAKISDELQLTLTALYGQGTTKTKRGYLNGASLDYSSGDGSAKVMSGRVRADWLNALSLGDTSISTFASYTLSRTEFGGYTETGGSFPVRWDDHAQTTHIVRTGIDTAKPVAEKVTLLGHVEANYQHDANRKGATGQIIGLNAFGGAAPKGGFGAQVGLGAEYDAGFGTATLTLNLSTGPNGRSGWVAASLRGAF